MASVPLVTHDGKCPLTLGIRLWRNPNADGYVDVDPN